MPFVTDLSPSLIFRYASTWITKYPSTVLKRVGHLEIYLEIYKEMLRISLGPNLNWLQSTQLSNPKELCFTRWVGCDKATIQRIPWELLKLDWRRVTWKKNQPVGVMDFFGWSGNGWCFSWKGMQIGGSMMFNVILSWFYTRFQTKNWKSAAKTTAFCNSGINQNYQNWKEMITNKSPSKIMCTYTVPAYTKNTDLFSLTQCRLWTFLCLGPRHHKCYAWRSLGPSWCSNFALSLVHFPTDELAVLLAARKLLSIETIDVQDVYFKQSFWCFLLW